jgi:hypothetical protein
VGLASSVVRGSCGVHRVYHWFKCGPNSLAADRHLNKALYVTCRFEEDIILNPRASRRSIRCPSRETGRRFWGHRLLFQGTETGICRDSCRRACSPGTMLGLPRCRASAGYKMGHQSPRRGRRPSLLPRWVKVREIGGGADSHRHH